MPRQVTRKTYICNACGEIDDDTDPETGLCPKCLKTIESEKEYVDEKEEEDNQDY